MTEKEKLEKGLNHLKERLNETDEDAGVLLMEKDEVLAEMKPLSSILANIEYKLQNLSITHDQLLKQYIRAKKHLENFDKEKEDEERGIYA